MRLPVGHAPGDPSGCTMPFIPDDLCAELRVTYES